MKKFLITLVVVVIAVILFFISSDRKKNIDSVKFSSWGSQSELNILKSVISDFERESGIKVNFVHIPQNYFQKIQLLFASDSQPDVIFMNNQYIKMYADAGLLLDLSDYFEDEYNLYFPQALNCFKFEDKLYAVPRDISNLVLYVNKDILEASGIQYKTKINDIYELKGILLKIKENGYYAINCEDKSLYWLYYLASQGAGVMSDDLKAIIINSKQGQNALNFYSDLINKYNAAPTKSQIGSMTTAQMFINGKLGMYLGGRWMTPKFIQTINFDWDIIEFPSSPENKVYIDSSGWAVSKKSKNIDAAIKFVKYISSANISEKFTKDGLIVPARKDVAEKYFNENDNLKPLHNYIFIKMLENSKPTPVNENYNKINDIINEKSREMFSGNKKAYEVFDDKTINKLESLL